MHPYISRFTILSHVWWLTPVIPAMQKVEIRKIKASPGKKI
jgi:hypothetical protein